MSLQKYQDLNEFQTIDMIDREILQLRKFLIVLRIEVQLMENKKIHLISHTKRKIAQLSFKRIELFKINNKIF